MPDSCTHLAGECPDREALRISRQNAACQLIHAAIRKTSRGGGALHSTPDLVLVMADTGTQPMTTGDSIESLSPTSEKTNLSRTTETPPRDWFAPLPALEEVRRRRHTEVFQNPRYNHWVSPPPTGTVSEPRPPAAYRIGSSHRSRPRCCL
jgi:hypothetical protein